MICRQRTRAGVFRVGLSAHSDGLGLRISGEAHDREKAHMDVSKPNGSGVLPPGHREIVAQCGGSYAAVNLALSEDGLYRFSTEWHSSRSGYGGPISLDAPGFSTAQAAITAGLQKLLGRWHSLFPSESHTVQHELAEMRRQIEARLRQRTLF
jgi:hypothetical protein